MPHRAFHQTTHVQLRTFGISTAILGCSSNNLPTSQRTHTHTHTPRGMCPVVSFWTSHDRPKSRGSVVHVSGFKAMEEDPTLRECPECQEPRGPRPGSCSPGVEVRGCEPTVIGDPVGDVEIRRVIGFFYCSLGDGFRGRSCEKGDRTW